MKCVEAISKNDLIQLKELLKSIKNPGDANYKINIPSNQAQNDIPFTGLTLLHISAYYNALECFIYLEIERGLGLRKLSTNGFYPLHYACRTGAYEVALYILSKDGKEAKIEVLGGGNLQMLNCAIKGGNPQIVRELFLNDCTITDEKNALNQAVGIGNKEIISLLLSHSIQKESASKGMTVAMYACMCNNLPVFEAIYTKADITAYYYNKNQFYSIFSILCSMDSSKLFKKKLLKILEEAQNCQIEPPSQGHQQYQKGVCHWACMYGDMEVARAMFKTQGVLPNRLDESYNTGPFHLINQKEPFVTEMLNFLINEQHFDINTCKGNGHPTLLESFSFCIQKNYKVIEFLVLSGANINAKHSTKNMTLYECFKISKDPKLRKIFNIK